MRAPTRIGVIGCGRAARNLHLPALSRIEQAEVVGVAGRSGRSAEEMRRAFGLPRAFADAGELLADDSIDAVCVATPTLTHAELALAAIEAGKHVLVEKPLALSLDECDTMIERAEARGVRAAVGFNMRWHPQVTRARELIRSGRIGEPRVLGTTLSGGELRSGRPEWRRDPARGGGALLRAAPHHIDLWRFLLDDEVARVSSSMSAWGRAGVLAAETEGGVGIATELSDSAGPTNELRVQGASGRLRASLYRSD